MTTKRYKPTYCFWRARNDAGLGSEMFLMNIQGGGMLSDIITKQVVPMGTKLQSAGLRLLAGAAPMPGPAQGGGGMPHAGVEPMALIHPPRFLTISKGGVPDGISVPSRTLSWGGAGPPQVPQASRWYGGGGRRVQGPFRGDFPCRERGWRW